LAALLGTEIMHDEPTGLAASEEDVVAALLASYPDVVAAPLSESDLGEPGLGPAGDGAAVALLARYGTHTVEGPIPAESGTVGESKGSAATRGTANPLDSPFNATGVVPAAAACEWCGGKVSAAGYNDPTVALKNNC
jgi:hypothetical protein